MRVLGIVVENDRLIFISHSPFYFPFAFLMEREVKEVAFEYKKEQRILKVVFN